MGPRTGSAEFTTAGEEGPQPRRRAGIGWSKKKKKSPLHSALFFIPTMGPADDGMRSLIYVKQTRRNCCAWSPRWVGEREFSKLVQHLGTQQILFANKGDFLYAIRWLPVWQPCLTIRRSRVRSRPRAFLRGGCLFLPASSRVLSWDPFPSQKNMPVELTGNEILGVSVDGCLSVCLAVLEVQNELATCPRLQPHLHPETAGVDCRKPCDPECRTGSGERWIRGWIS